MKIVLKDKKTEPSFKYYVKLNAPCFDYYVFDDFDQAMNKARVLSLTEFPIVIVMEPDKDKNGEWKFIQTFKISKESAKNIAKVMSFCICYLCVVYYVWDCNKNKKRKIEHEKNIF